jgi:archaellum component FlaC
MQIRTFSSSIFLAFLLCLFASPAIHAKKMYKWVDEHGKTFFSDQVPPEQSELRRESLNEKGRVVEVTEKAKTKEQLAQDERLNALKQAQEKVIAQQLARDNVLLNTFRNLDDMQAALAGKMQAMDNQKHALEGNLKRVESQLETQQKKAAAIEHKGTKIPQPIVDEIKATQAQIQVARGEINKHDEKIKAEFEADIERFKFLTKANTDTQKPSATIADELGLYPCDSDAQCSNAWEIARNFINAHSTTGIEINTDKLILAHAPATDSDLSLSLTKIEGADKKHQLFLDIRCRESSLGKELCAGQKAKDIRSAFKPFIEAALAK